MEGSECGGFAAAFFVFIFHFIENGSFVTVVMYSNMLLAPFVGFLLVIEHI